jgi:hypothetical protein
MYGETNSDVQTSPDLQSLAWIISKLGYISITNSHTKNPQSIPQTASISWKKKSTRSQKARGNTHKHTCKSRAVQKTDENSLQTYNCSNRKDLQTIVSKGDK